MSVTRALIVAAALAMAACGPPPPYVRYQGNVYKTAPKHPSDIVVLRAAPPAARRYEDLGTVVVTCPSEAESDGFGTTQLVGGCSYEWAVLAAGQRAAGVGADGIHTISSQVNSAGYVVHLTATAFVYLPQRVEAPAPPSAPSTTVEERLEHLEKLRADQAITPEEYAKKRAEILDDI
jgi:hypothetical protein